MVNRLRGTLGFVLGISTVAAAAHAAQPQQHEHGTPPAAQNAPSHSMEQMHKMMADPAKRQQMMERMAHCRDMMAMMMEHMQHEGMNKDQPTPQK